MSDHQIPGHQLRASCMAFFYRNVVLIFGILFLGFYWLLFAPESSGYEEVIVENGVRDFTASFGTVTAIVPANQDPELAELLDEESIAIQITILDSEGNAAGIVTMQGCRIHTDGFITTENLTQSGVPLALVVGETYTLEYEAYCEEIELTELSFSLCGDKIWLTTENIAVLVLFLAFFAGVILIRPYQKKGMGSSYQYKMAGWILIYLALAFLLLLSVPMMNEVDAERTAFADAYAISNSILGQEAFDSDGYVYIAESGIRNMGYLSYSVPLHRFWTNWSYGNLISERSVCTLYQVSGNSPSVVTLLDGAAIALTRLAGMPYQIVYLSGKLLNLIIGFLIYLIILRLLCSMKDHTEESLGIHRSFHPMAAMVLLIFLLPSMMQGLMSYQSGALSAAACLLSGTLLWRFRKEKVGCHIVIFLGACVILVAVVRIILSDGLIPSVVLHTILSQSDEWLTGLVCSTTFVSDRMDLACLCLAGVLIVLWIRMRNCLHDRSKCSISGHSVGVRSGSISGPAAWLIGTMAVILSGGIEPSETGYMILAGVQPVLFLPLALIPFVHMNHTNKDKNESVTDNSFVKGICFPPREGDDYGEKFCRYAAEVVLIIIVWIDCSCML